MNKPNNFNNEELKTYDEWKKLGYGVLKGQHCCLRKNGKCYFSRN